MESPFRCPGFPEVWCFDANTELDYSDPRKALGNPVCVPAHSNALRTFLRERPHLSSVWAGLLANVTTLPEDNLERWRTHLRAIQLVNVLCETPEGDPLVIAFHAKFVKGAADDAQFHALLQAGLGKAGDVRAQVDDETAKLLARLRVA